MMRFQLDITLTEEDYLAFNLFHTLESSHAKKQAKKRRTSCAVIGAFLTIYVALTFGRTNFLTMFVTVVGVIAVLLLLFFRRILIWGIKRDIKQLKQTGKLPFDPVSKLEFYEDTLVEISPTARTELRYDALEHICVVKGRFVLLYSNSIGAYILPISQVHAQLDHSAFLLFLSQKCSIVEYY